jgi:hypothetical protein
MNASSKCSKNGIIFQDRPKNYVYAKKVSNIGHAPIESPLWTPRGKIENHMLL